MHTSISTLTDSHDPMNENVKILKHSYTISIHLKTAENILFCVPNSENMIYKNLAFVYVCVRACFLRLFLPRF